MELKEFLYLNDILDYHIEDDMINVNGDVRLKKIDDGIIPYKFNVINGNFYVDNVELIDLVNSPNLVRGSFSCSRNKLTSLENSPDIVECVYDCSHNNLDNLNFISSGFSILFCYHNNLTSLYGIPKVLDILDFNNNKITKIDAELDSVRKITASFNSIYTFENFPKNLDIITLNSNPVYIFCTWMSYDITKTISVVNEYEIIKSNKGFFYIDSKNFDRFKEDFGIKNISYVKGYKII